MKGKDFVRREVQNTTPDVLKGQTQYNSAQETPFFLGQINADRTKIIDTTSGKEYNLHFTGNPREFEYASATSPFDAVVNAQQGKFINVDGETKNWILYSNLGSTNYYAKPISEVDTSGANTVRPPNTGPVPLESAIGLSLSEAATQYFADKSLCIYDFKTDSLYYFPTTEPIFQFTEGMYPKEFSTSQGYLLFTGIGTQQQNNVYNYPVAVSGDPIYASWLDETTSQLVIFRIEAMPSVSSIPYGTSQITSDDPPLHDHDGGYPFILYPSGSFYCVSDIQYTVNWAIYTGLGLSKDPDTQKGTIKFAPLTEENQGSYVFNYQFPLGQQPEGGSSSEETSGPVVGRPDATVTTITTTITSINSVIYNNVMSVIPTVTRDSITNKLRINVYGVFQSNCTGTYTELGTFFKQIVDPHNPTFTQTQTSEFNGFTTRGYVSGIYLISDIANVPQVSYVQLFDEAAYFDHLHSGLTATFNLTAFPGSIGEQNNGDGISVPFKPINFNSLSFITGLSYFQGYIPFNDQLSFTAQSRIIDQNGSAIQPGSFTMLLYTLPNPTPIDTLDFPYEGFDPIVNAAYLESPFHLYNQLEGDFPTIDSTTNGVFTPADPLFQFSVKRKEPENLTGLNNLISDLLEQWSFWFYRKTQTWEVLDLITQGIPFTGDIEQYAETTAFGNPYNDEFKILRKLTVGVDSKTGKLIVKSVKKINIPKGSRNWQGPKTTFQGIQNVIFK